ncbi:long-chain-fatty-acid--CoA ligase [Mycetocola spongiae]|uniref:long-chain-fatty-acid--CoA ligase n=1 Tax=Mycetocola spongiae TaxID=2859226 RepID=UPI001CF46619|nr:long-chain-fatty-acid--CoA ligase [Mycetocola spongiae]UCR89675.1 long-chain fatty acid--CoA ligase [Mycetocola spongiae]
MSTAFVTKPWLSAYAPGVPFEIEEVTETLVDMIDSSVHRFTNSPALDFFGRSVSYSEVGDQISRAANGLRRLGVKKGDRVALVLPNCPQHIIAFYAVLRLGAIAVEHNPLYTERELRHQFEDHGATVAIVWDKLHAVVQGFPASMGVDTVIAVDVTRAMPFATRTALRLPVAKARESREALTAGRLDSHALTWSGLVNNRRLRRSHPRPGLEDTAVLQYTSGTTGTPKGAILSHRNLRANASQGEAWVQGLRPGREVVYAILPMFHAYGLTLCVTFAMSIGARLVLLPKFDEKLVLDAMKRTPATFLPAVPPIYSRLVDAAEARGVSLSGIRNAISGAMSLPVATVRKWEDATGGLLVEGYGMTESSPVALGNPMGPSRRPGTVGVPFPSTEIRVIDPKDPTVDRGFEEEGELLVRGPQVFGGYWNRPDDTAMTLLPGGWLRTGDVVTVSEDGYVTIVDRLKELIITGGFNVAPTEVETVLNGHPDVIEASVVGLPSSTGGEKVVAAAVLREGADLSAAQLREWAHDRMAAYKVPRRITLIEELPRSIVGKVLRREVRELLIAAETGDNGVQQG